MEEVRYAVEKYQINFFTFQDELFAYDKPRALEFCRKFRDYTKTLPYRVEMYCNLRVDCADAEILDAMKEAGNTVIGLGLESMSQVVLTSMRKHITPEQTRKCFELIAERKQVPQGVFIFGDPAETLETAKETLDFIKYNQHLCRGGIFIGFIIPFPGTAIYRDAVKSGIIPNEAEFIETLCKDGYYYKNIMNFTKLSDEDFLKLKDMVFTAQQGNPEAIPRLVEKVGDHTKVMVTCPHCKTKQVYYNTGDPKIQYVPIICQNSDCKGRFDIVSWRLALMKWAIRTFGYRRLNDISTAIINTKKKIMG
jgi:hypothetical protein